MSDPIAGRPAGGARQGGGGPKNGGAPPPVLVGALAAAFLIAVVLFVTLGRFGGGDDDAAVVPARDAPADRAAATAQRERVRLTVTMLGSGDGILQIQPGDIACIESCEHEFDRGTSVSATADPGSGSRFGGWSDACDGSGRCSIVMDRPRTLDATFEARASKPLTDEDLDAAGDALDAEDLDPGADEAGAAPASNCSDGQDNDRDGLTDSAQDPDCVGGRSEGGKAAPPATGGTTATTPAARAPAQCRDGKDNDGDGLIDTAQDPGCEDDSTEA